MEVTFERPFLPVPWVAQFPVSDVILCKTDANIYSNILIVILTVPKRHLRA